MQARTVPTRPEDARVGCIVADRYEVLSRVGLGTLGVIYEARHVALGRRLTLEVLEAELIDREAVREQFKSTFGRLARVRHRNVVEMESFGVDPEGSLYVATEHTGAPRLDEEIERVGRLPWLRARGLVLQICAAVEAAHRRKVVHGSLRPGACHVLGAPTKDSSECVKVTDFARNEIAAETHVAADAKGATTRLSGDPRYLALEQFISGKSSVASDVYALGAVLYHLLTGVPPHAGINAFQVLNQRKTQELTPPRTLEPAIPEAIEAVIIRALSIQPDARHTTMGELLLALEAVPANANGTPTPPAEPDVSLPRPPPSPLVVPAMVEAPDPVVMVEPLRFEDEATVMMARLGSNAHAHIVEATTLLGARSPTLMHRALATEVLDVNAVRTLQGAMVDPSSRVQDLGPTERLVHAHVVAPAPTALLLTVPLAAPSLPTPQPRLGPPLALPAPPMHTDTQATPPASARLWPLALVATLVVAALGAFVGFALAQGSTGNNTSLPAAETSQLPKR